MGEWEEVPAVVIEGTKHYLGPETMTHAVCGVKIPQEVWAYEKEPPGFCWNCVRIQHLYDVIKFQGYVVTAAEAWAQDPESGPLRGALSEALERYRKFDDFHNNGEVTLEDPDDE